MTVEVLSTYERNIQKKATNFSYKTHHNNSFLLGFFIRFLGFQSIFFQRLDWNPPTITLRGEFTRKRKVKQFSCEYFFFNTHLWRPLESFGHLRFVQYVKDLGFIYVIKCPGWQWKIESQHFITESNFFVNTSYQLSEKNTFYFCWRLLWWKIGLKSHVIVIRKSFLNDCYPSDPAIPFACSCVC